MKKPTALFVARFQPLHKGHLHAMKEIMKKYNLVVGIGSVNKKDGKNPFSFEQRERMLRSALKGKYKIIALYDNPDNRKWTKQAERKARFDVVVSGNSLVRYCFRKYGSRNYKIIYPSFLKLRIYDASRIRSAIRRKLKWHNLVPKKIIDLVKRFSKL